MIYIVKHKEYENPVPKGYKELYVGEMYDGKGDNINHLNRYLNELTAYYDLWKNSKDKNIGICHYRRFFAENGEILTSKRVTDILKTNDIIVTTKFKDPATLYWFLRADLVPTEYRLYDKYIGILDNAVPGFREYMIRQNEFYPREMIIANRKVFDALCEELFEALIPAAELYDKEDSSSGTNPRLLGFIAERFISYLIVKNGLKAYEMDFIEV